MPIAWWLLVGLASVHAGPQDDSSSSEPPFQLDTHAALTGELKRYKAAEVVWCQEEPLNMGGWTFVDRRIEAVLLDIGGRATRPVYVGRAAAAAAATGSLKRHLAEQAKLVDEALTIG